MEKFRKICGIMGLVASVIATILGVKGWYNVFSSGSGAGELTLLAAGILSFFSYILAGGIMHTIKAALSLVKWGFVFWLDMPAVAWIFGPLTGLSLALASLMFLPFFPVFFVYPSVQEKGLLQF